MSGKGNDPILSCASPADWAAWLAQHHATAGGVWLKIPKKEAGSASVTYAAALDAALCYGWIDGQKGSFDDQYWLQRFTRRKPRSGWSRINRAKATALIEQGAMQPAGRREVEQAQADGRWDAAYAGQRTATVPDDLRQALDQHPVARDCFATLDSANRYAILYRVQEAKKPETRARRIAEYVAMLSEGRKIHA
jgi:uncharacterized protein YdeI (YjbR/CyaY-like superfamily)